MKNLVFYSLLVLIFLTAIPYGSTEPWWRAAFQSLVFLLAILAIIGRLLRGGGPGFNFRLFLPLLVLSAYAFLQTLSLPGFNRGAPLSADPFQTRQFIVHLFALMIFGWLLLTHTTSRRRLRLLLDVIVTVGVLSAGFGLARQASQHAPGFVLPQLVPGYGYAQFINPNHFAFLMEMALGLALGTVICGGVRGKRLVLYVGAAVPMWVALVLSNSRGGILSILCQVVFLAILFVDRRYPRSRGEGSEAPRGLITAGRRVVIHNVLIAVLLIGAVVTVIFVGGDPLAGRLQQVQVEFSPGVVHFAPKHLASDLELDQRTSAGGDWLWRLLDGHHQISPGFGRGYAARGAQRLFGVTGERRLDRRGPGGLVRFDVDW